MVPQVEGLVTQGPDAVHYPYLMLSHGYSFTIRLTTDELEQWRLASGTAVEALLGSRDNQGATRPPSPPARQRLEHALASYQADRSAVGDAAISVQHCDIDPAL